MIVRLGSIQLTFMLSAMLLATTQALAFAAAQPAEAELIGQLKQTKENIAEGETERRRLLGSLYAINQRMKRISSRKGQLTDELFLAQESVKNVVSAIGSLETQIARQRDLLRKRLRAMYKLSGEGYLSAIFSEKNAYELDSTMRSLRIVSDYDYQTIRSYRGNIKSLAAHRKKLKAQVERLLVVERRIQKQESLLAIEHRAKTDLAATVEAKTQERLSEMKTLRSQVVASASDNELAELLKPSMFERKGHLAAPLKNGVLSRGFGLFIDPKYKFRTNHKGWRIRREPVAAVQPVLAIDEGQVVFRGPAPGHAETIIIDHRDHYYTVYCGEIETSVRVGEKVARDQAIGRVHSDLYFEIRHFSEPEDPAAWIKVAPGLLTSAHEADDNKQKQHVVME